MEAKFVEGQHRISAYKRNKKDMKTLSNAVKLIFAKLNLIKMQSKNGYVLNEVLERTQILAHNIDHEPALVDEIYIKDYQKNIWQLLKKLDRLDTADGSLGKLEEHKAMFFEIYQIMDSSLTGMVQEKKEKKHSSLVFAY